MNNLRITHIKAANLKGLTFSHDLGPSTLFVGPSASGKTARLNAIVLALLGYIPKLGKRPSDTFKLCSAEKMGVEATLSDGTTITRFWELKKDKIETGTSCMGPNGGSAGTGILEVPTILLDPMAYFSLSDRDRAAMVFSELPVDKWDLDMLKSVITERLSLNHPAEALKSLMARLDALKPLCPDNWLEASVATLRGLKNEAAATVRRLAASAQTSLDQQAKVPVGLSPEPIRQQINTLDKQYEAMVTDEATLRAKLPVVPSLDKLKGEIAAAKAKLDRRKDEYLKLEDNEPSDKCPTCDHKLSKAKKKQVHADYFLEVEKAGKAIEDARQKLNKLNEMLAAAEKIVKADNSKELEMLAQNREAMGKKIDELVAKEREALRYQSQIASAQAALAQRQQVERELEAVKHACDILESELEAQSVHTMSVLMEEANKIASPALKTPLCMSEKGLGRVTNGRFVHHDTFSGTETILTHSAVAVALAAKYPLKLLIMDELGIADMGTQDVIFESVHKALTEGVIHQFIGAAVDSNEGTTFKGTVIDV